MKKFEFCAQYLRFNPIDDTKYSMRCICFVTNKMDSGEGSHV